MADSQAPESNLLDEVKNLNKRLDEANAAVAQGKLWARALMIVLFLAVVFGIWTIIKPFKAAYDEPKPYLDAISSQLENRLAPRLESEVKSLMETTGRQVFELASAKAQERSDDLAKAFDAELAALLEELQAFGEETLSAMVVDFELEVRDLLTELSGDEGEDPDRLVRVLDNAAEAIRGAVRRAVDKELADHIGAIIDIEQLIVDFPILPEYEGLDNTELSDLLVSELGNYALHTLKLNLDPSTREVLRDLSEE